MKTETKNSGLQTRKFIDYKKNLKKLDHNLSDLFQHPLAEN